MEWGPGERPVFGVGGRTVLWRDVLAWAEETGALADVAAASAAGAARLEGDGPPRTDAVREAGTAFRYARGLLAADEMEAWLARWELTVDEWLSHLRRQLAGESNSLLRGPGPADARDVLVDAVCSGALERWARELAARLAVAPDASGHELEERFDAFRRATVTDEAVAREVEGRRLDWLRVEGEVVAVDDEDVAREVALCAREDGDPLDELAVRAGGRLAVLDSYLDDAAPALAAALLGAREGEILGPLADGGAWLVARARRKTPPAPDDPAVRERAAERVLARAVGRELERRVTWHDGA